MATFHYSAVDPDGAVLTGTVEAVDERAAARKLQRDGHTPIRIGTRPQRSLRAILDMEITPRDPFSTRDRSVMTRSLATLISAGLPVDRALETLRDLGTSAGTRRIAGSLLEDVRSGMSLSAAVEKQPRAFPPLYRGILRAGETGARLGETLDEMATMLEQTQRRIGEMRSALIYPAFLIVTAIASVAILLAFVVPTFEPLLQDAGVEPPVITQIVIGSGRFVERFWHIGLGLLLAQAVLTRLALRRTGIRRRWHLMQLRLPWIGAALLKFETARLTRLIGTMLTSGVALPHAIRLAADAASNTAIAQELQRVQPEVEAGRGFAGPLRDGALFPPLALQLIQVGQEAGNLPAMLLKIADIFDAEAKQAFDQMLSLLTPVITLVMGVVIAVIISSILFALFSINELAI